MTTGPVSSHPMVKGKYFLQMGEVANGTGSAVAWKECSCYRCGSGHCVVFVGAPSPAGGSDLVFRQRPSIPWVVISGFRTATRPPPQGAGGCTHTGENWKEKRNKDYLKILLVGDEMAELQAKSDRHFLVFGAWVSGMGRAAHRDHSWYRCLSSRVRSWLLAVGNQARCLPLGGRLTCGSLVEILRH